MTEKILRLTTFAASIVISAFITSVKAENVKSCFFSQEKIDIVKQNIKTWPWAKNAAESIIANAQPWAKMSDQQLWELMFSPSITRSWMVLSDGFCPKCKASVTMYNWQIDPLTTGMWKVRCPSCGRLFPTNDFEKFYKSGLNKKGIFDPNLADRSLLFNAEHPDANDPLHKFGVDDGEGYTENGKKWRFIGNYLIFGQWMKLVQGGIGNLSSAYVVTQDKQYAHKAAILLDRVADLYPMFDFSTQAVIYEKPGVKGYVTVWYCAAEETREMALAYDMIKEGIQNDPQLVQFLSQEAAAHGVAASKSSEALIRQNIENGILNDALAHDYKIWANYPLREVALIIIRNVLGGAENKEIAERILDEMITKASEVDGVTGEKGLDGYASVTINRLATLIALLDRQDANFLGEIVKSHPNLLKTWRFHIDTLCLQDYYPRIGDAGYYAYRDGHYCGMQPNLGPLDVSLYELLWKFYAITGEPEYVQIIYKSNSNSVTDLPKNLFCRDPAKFRQDVNELMNRTGSKLKLPSVNKQNWGLAILRGGSGKEERAVWLSYKSGGVHGHRDGLTLGLFAKGLDLAPDLGYPPVEYGGWESRFAKWYSRTASHNTVMVDGQNQMEHGQVYGASLGKTTLWEPNGIVKAIRVRGPEMMENKCTQYERTVLMADVSDEDFYVLDIFRVIGGNDHAKFFGSHFGNITTKGLNLSPCEAVYDSNMMKDFMVDSNAAPGWSVDWKIEDRYKYLCVPDSNDLHVCYTDLTSGAKAYVLKSWIQAQGTINNSAWINRLMVRHNGGDMSVGSTFVSIIEPYKEKAAVRNARKIHILDENGNLYPDNNVAVEILLADGTRDITVAMDADNPAIRYPAYSLGHKIILRDHGIETDAQITTVRIGPDGSAVNVFIGEGDYIRVGGIELHLTGNSKVGQFKIKNGKQILD